MRRASVAGAAVKGAMHLTAAVKKRTNKSSVDADSRNVPVKYEDTQTQDKRRVALLHLTRRSDPLGIVWDVRHIGFTAMPRALLSWNMLAVFAAYAATCVTTFYGYWPLDDDSTILGVADYDIDALQGMELLVTFNLCAPACMCSVCVWSCVCAHSHAFTQVTQARQDTPSHHHTITPTLTISLCSSGAPPRCASWSSC